MHKRITALLISLMIFLTPFFDGVVYAAGDVSGWYNVTTTEQAAEAFRYYCKSRDLTLEGSALDVLTSFTTQFYTDLCHSVGLDMDAIQADLKYTTDQNGNLKFLLNATGMSAFNRLFSQFLQDHELEVGDSIPEDDPITLYSGELFSDDNGNSCLVTYYSSASNATNIVRKGSAYLYEFAPLCNDIIHDNDNTYEFQSVINGANYNFVGYFNRGQCYCNIANTGAFYLNRYNADMTLAPQNAFDGFISVGKIGTYYYLGFYTESITGADYPFYWQKKSISPNNTKAANVFIYSPTTINNNTYEGNTYTTINNEGDTNNYYIDTEPDPDDPIGPTPDPVIPPGGTTPDWPIGGGDGTVDDPDGNTWNIHFPDFELPDLNIDWSINGLGNKFPFSIPFDLVALITVLNAEPVSPEFQGTVDFGFTTWDYDIDLSPFDNVAAVCRIAELLLLVFGLIMVTRSIIKG